MAAPPISDPENSQPLHSCSTVKRQYGKKLEKEGHMRQARYRFFLLPLIFVLACVAAFAQANSELTGIVTDQTGAVVPGRKNRHHRSGYWHYEDHSERCDRLV